MTRDLYANNRPRHRLLNGDLATTQEILDALARLHTACCLGHPNRPDGSRGRNEYEAAMTQARHVLQRSRKYGEVQP